MPILLEKPIQEEELEEKAVQADTGIGTIQTPTRDADLYSRFLALPAAVVLLTLWLAGAALVSVCGVALYLLWTLIVPVAMG